MNFTRYLFVFSMVAWVSLAGHKLYGQCTPSLSYDSSNSLCDGDALNLTATTNLPSGCALSPGSPFEWTQPGAGVTTTSINTLDIAAADAGDYTVRVNIVDDGSGNCPCTNGFTPPSNVVTVNDRPDDPTPIAPIDICPGETATFTANSGGSGTNGDFYWYDGAGANATLLFVGNPFTTPALTSTTTYHVEEKLGDCISNGRTAAVANVVAVPAIPAATATATCPGNTSTLTATSNGTNGDFNWYSDAAGTNLVFVGNPYITAALTANTSFWVKEVNGPCESALFQVDVTVTDITDPTVTSPSICENDFATVTATTGGDNGDFHWYSDAAGNNLIFVGNPFITPNLTSTTSYWVKEVVGPCESNLVQSTVNVNVTINPPVASGMTICEDDSASLSASTGGANGDFYWYDAATGGTLLFVGSPYVTPNLTSTTTYHVEERSGNCTSTRTAVTVTVNATPAQPTVTGDDICPNETPTLTASGSGNLNWYDVPAGGTLLFTGATFIPANPIYQTTYYYVENEDPSTGCISDRVSVTALVNPAVPSPAAPSNMDVCFGDMAVIPATGSGTAGNELRWYDVPVGGTPIQTNTMGGATFTYTSPALFNPPAAVNYYVSEYDATTDCESPRTAIRVDIHAEVPQPQALDRTICTGDSVILNATGGVGSPGGDFHWYDATTGGNLLHVGQFFTPAQNLIANTGSYDFFVEEVFNGCPSTTRDQVTVTVAPISDPTTNTPAAICPGDPATLTATSGGANGVFDWYDAPGGNLLFTGNPYVVTPATTTTYHVVERFGNCESNPISVTVTVTPLTDPTVNSPSTCDGNSVDLIATTGGANGSFEWYDAPGGNLLFTGNPFTVTPSTTTNYYVVEVAAGCQTNAVMTTVTVSAIADPTASATAICPGETSTATAVTGGSNGDFYWYDASQQTLLFVGNPFLVAPNTTTDYYVVEMDGNCESNPVLVQVNVTPIPDPTVTTPADICPGDVATITATTGGTNGTFLWYDAASGGNLIFTGNPYSVSPSTTTTYYVSETNGLCETNRIPVTVTVVPLVDPTIAQPSDICPGDTAIITATSGGANGVFEWYDAPGGNLLYVGNPFTVGPQMTTTYYVVETANGCASMPVSTTVTVTQIASPTVNSPATCPGNSVDLEAISGGANGTFQWYDPATNNLLFVGNPYTVTPNTTTSYQLVEFDGNCSSDPVLATVTVTPIDDPTVSATDICPGETSVVTAVTGGSNGVFEWYDAAQSQLLFVGNPFHVAPNVTTDYYVVEVDGNCESNPVLIQVNVAPLTDPTAITPQPICPNDTAVITAVTGGTNGTFLWYDAAQGGNLLFTGNPYTVGPQATTTYWVSETNGLCETNRIPVTVTVNPLPDPSIIQPSDICRGDTAIITALTGGSNGTFEWYDAAGGNLLFVGNPFTVGPNDTTDYYVVERFNGCASNAIMTTVNVTQISAPTVNAPSTCPGNPDTLTAVTGGANGVFEWYDPISGNLLFTGNPYIVTPPTTTDYLVVERVANCYSDTIQTTVTVTPINDPTVSATDICPGETSVVTAVTGGSNGVFEWYDAAQSQLLFVGNPFHVAPNVTTDYYVVEVDGDCESNPVLIQVNVIPLTDPTAITPQPICPNDTAVITAVTGGTNGTFLWYDAAQGGNLLFTGNPYTVGPQATTTYWVSETNGLCETNRIPVTVTVAPIADPSIIQPSDICRGDTAIITALTGGSNGTFEWYDAPGGNLLFVGNPFTVGPNDTTDYYVVERFNGCASNAIMTTVNVTQIGAPTVNAPSTCPGNPDTLTAVTGGANGVFEWYDPISGNLLFTGNPYIVTPPTTTDYLVVERVANCYSDTIQTTVTVTPINDPTVSATDICPGETSVVTAVTGGSNGVFEWYDAAQSQLLFVGNPFHVAPNVTTDYYVVEVDGDCESNPVLIQVNVIPLTDPTAITPQPICPNDTAVITAVTGGTNGTFLWYDAASGGNLLFTGNPYTVGPQATTTYWVSETNGLCETNRIPVTVTVAPIADPSIIQPSDICRGDTAIITALTGGSNGTFEWYDAPGGNLLFVGNPFTVGPNDTTDYYVVERFNGCASNAIMTTVNVTQIGAPTVNAPSTCPGNPDTLTAVTGGANGVFEWYDPISGNLLFTGNPYIVTPPTTTDYLVVERVANCYSDTIQTTVTVTPINDPTVSATDICPGETSVVTAVTGGSNGVFEWYDAAQSQLLFVGNPFHVAPNVTTDYYVVEVDGNCESNPVLIQVNVIPLTDPTAITPQPICPNDTAVITAVTGGTNGTFLWYDAAQGGNLLFTGNPYTVGPQTTTTYWVSETNGLCETNRIPVTVTVAPIADPSIIQPSDICRGDTAIITALTGGSNGTFEWYDAPGGNLLFVGNPFTVGPNDTTNYYVVERFNGCASNPIMTTVNVTQIGAPTVNAPSTCPGNPDTLTAVTGGANGVFEWYDPISGNLLFTGNPYIVTPPTTTDYLVVERVANCYSDTIQTTVTVTPINDPTVSATDICPGETSVVTAVTGGSNGVFEWYDAAQSQLLFVGNPFHVAPNVTTDYYVVEVDGDCESNPVLIQVNVIPLTDPTAITPQPICPNDTAVITAVTGGTNGTFLWYDAAQGGNLLFTGNPYTVGPQATTTYWVSETNGLCETNRIPVTVTVAPIADPTIIQPSDICRGDTAIITALTGGSNGTFEWYDAPGGNLLFVGNPFTVGPNDTTDYYVVERFNGCASNAIMTTVNVTQIGAPTVNAPSTCPGNPDTLTAVTGGANGVFEWYDPISGNLLFTGNPYIVTPPTTTDYLVVERVANCYSDTIQTTVTVTPINDPTVSATDICPGETSVVTAVSGGSNGVFEWYDAAQSQLLFVGNPFHVAPNVTTDYYVVEVDGDCESNPVLIQVNVIPLTDPTAITPQPICPNDTAVITAVTGGTNGTFLWYDAAQGGNLLFTGNPYTVGPQTTTTYWVSETNGLCETNRIPVTVTVAPIADPSIIQPSDICPGDTAIITALSGGSNGTFEWYDTPGGNLLFVGNPFTVGPQDTTTYYVVERFNGCASNPVATTVNVTPIANPTVASPSATCPGNSVTLNATSGGANGIFEWYDPITGNLLFVGNGFVVTPLVTTDYEVVEKLGNCHSDTISVTAVVTPLTNPTASATATCPGDTSVATAVSGGANGYFEWYDAQVGGNLIFVGNPLLVAPPTTTDYFVVEVDGNCRSERVLVQVNVTPLPEPTAATSQSAICEGEFETITATTGGSNGDFYWYDAPSGGNLVFIGNPYITATLTTTTTYWVTEVTQFCESPRHPIVVNVDPKPSAPVLGNNGPLCEGDSLSLTATTISNAHYDWFGPNGYSSTLQNPSVLNVHEPDDQGVYYVIVTDLSTGCMSDTAQTVVEINEIPQTPTLLSNSEICDGEDLILTTNEIADAGYNWNGPSGSLGTTSNPTFIINAAGLSEAGVYDVSVTVRGCTSPVGATTVVVNPIPAAPSAFNNGPLCAGADLLLDASTTVGGEYSWTGPNGFSSTLQSVFQNAVDTSFTGSYLVNVTVNGCTSPDGSTFVRVNLNPELPGDSVSNNGPLCEGETLNLIASPVDSVSYTWTGPNGFSSDDRTPTIASVLEANHQGTYTVVLTDTLTGCTSEPISTLVEINATPQTAAADNDGPGCEGTDIQLLASSVNGASYSWAGPNGFTSTDQNPLLSGVTTSNTGDYQVVIDVNGCSSAIGTTSILVVANPVADAGPDVTIFEEESVQLSGSGGLNFIWSPAGTLDDPRIFNPVATPPLGDNTYTLTVFDENLCFSSDSVTVTVIPQTELFVFDLFTPNGDGTNDFWVVKFIQNISNYTVTMFDRGGETIFETDQYNNDWDGTYNGKNLPEGTYWYVIRTEQKEYKGAVTLLR